MPINETIKTLSDIGWTGDASDQGRDCIAFTEREQEAQEKVKELAGALQQKAQEKGLNLEIQEDPFGNVYVTLQGRSEQRILMCSHIDSVPHGGRYDGIAGIAGGLEVLEKIIDAGIVPQKTIQVASFRAEESSKTGMSCLGSSLAAGLLTIEDLQRIKHEVFGKDMLKILMERGLSTEEIDTSIRTPYIRGEKLDAVMELHVEQSGVLESLNHPLGVVINGIGGALRRKIKVGEIGEKVQIPGHLKPIRISIKGTASHSGGTPMNGEMIAAKNMAIRRDALAAMARILSRIPVKYLTKLDVPGGSFNVVPGECVAEIYTLRAYLPKIHEIMDDYLLTGMEGTVEVIERPTPEEEIISGIREEVVDAAMSVITETERVAEDIAIRTRGLVRATVGNAIIEEDETIILHMDERRLDNAEGDRLNTALNERFRDISEKQKVPVQEVESGEDRRKISLATPFENDEIQRVIRGVHTEMFGKNPPAFGSMPGHDAAKMCRSDKTGRAVPTGMIFVRGQNHGISHNPSEYSTPKDLEMGSKLLHEVVKRLAF